ncbi:MAG: T9SS type A sorting domain-containing protein [Flavobacteriales bacterium]
MLKNGTATLEINTFTFQNVQLDSALTYAASFMEVYDSLGNDATAVELFHEILNSGLNRDNSEIRELTDWGLNMMKISIENMFVNEELQVSQNQTAFDPYTQKYVDMLNLHTDSVLTSETYRSQFETELKKGQLFLTLRSNFLALEVFENLNNCPLDSLEQATLHNWKQKAQTYISLQNAISLGYSPDSLSTLETETTMPYITQTSQSNYSFGVNINSPTSLSFVSCGNTPTYRNLIEPNYEESIFPNPTREILFVKIKENEGIINSLIIHDMMGKLVYSEAINLEGNFTHQVNLPSTLASGQYFLRVISTDGQSKSFEFIKQ